MRRVDRTGTGGGGGGGGDDGGGGGETEQGPGKRHVRREAKSERAGSDAIRVGVIGAGGRKEDGDGVTPRMLDKIAELVPLLLRHHFRIDDCSNLELASNGGPFCSHVAIRLWLDDAFDYWLRPPETSSSSSSSLSSPSSSSAPAGQRIEWRALHLYLPVPLVDGKYNGPVGEPITRAAATVYNQLHAQCSRQLGEDTLSLLTIAANLDAHLHVSSGFLARDERLAEACDVLVAFSSGDSGSEPKAGSGGAVRQAWDYCRGRKLHVRLKQLDAELAHYRQLHARAAPRKHAAGAAAVVVAAPRVPTPQLSGLAGKPARKPPASTSSSSTARGLATSTTARVNARRHGGAGRGGSGGGGGGRALVHGDGDDADSGGLNASEVAAETGTQGDRRARGEKRSMDERGSDDDDDDDDDGGLTHVEQSTTGRSAKKPRRQSGSNRRAREEEEEDDER